MNRFSGIKSDYEDKCYEDEHKARVMNAEPMPIEDIVKYYKIASHHALGETHVGWCKFYFRKTIKLVSELEETFGCYQHITLVRRAIEIGNMYGIRTAPENDELEDVEQWLKSLITPYFILNKE